MPVRLVLMEATGVSFPEAGVTGSYESPDTGTVS